MVSETAQPVAPVVVLDPLGLREDPDVPETTEPPECPDSLESLITRLAQCSAHLRADPAPLDLPDLLDRLEHPEMVDPMDSLEAPDSPEDPEPRDPLDHLVGFTFYL